MHELFAQLRVLTANIYGNVKAILHENELLRKEVVKLQEEIKQLKDLLPKEE